MRASTVRTCAAAAAVPAVLVVIAHLAYVWHQHPSSADRQASAFVHGMGLAAILAAVLAAGRIAQWLDGETPHVWAGAVATAGTIAVLAHLADDWRAGTGAIRSVHILVVHLALLALIAVAYQVIRRVEDAHSTPDARPR
jgi:hypothetical protein